MIQCPFCSKETNQNFGMVTCEGCSQVFMIDFSGNVEVAESPSSGESSGEFEDVAPAPQSSIVESLDSFSNESSLESREENSAVSDDLNSFSSISGDDHFLPEQGEESLFDSSKTADDFNFESGLNGAQSTAETADFFQSSAQDMEEDLTQDSAEGISDEFSHEPGQSFESMLPDPPDGLEENRNPSLANIDQSVSVEANTFNDFESIKEQGRASNEDHNGVEVVIGAAKVASEVKPSSKEVVSRELLNKEKRDPKAPLDITEFANSQRSTRQGEYLYDLSISSIDDRELRENVHGILAEPRLRLSHKELMATLDQGHLIIRDLSPVKAKRIVEQLQFLDVQVFWEQRPVNM